MLSGPPINTTVTVHAVSWDAACRTRVEDLHDEVVVAAPVAERDERDPALGAPLLLQWQGERGPMSLGVTLVAKELRHVPVWHLRPHGPVVITQRRHHARADVLVRVVVEAGGGAVHGQAVDFSEGGLRMVHQGGHRLVAGERVQVCLRVDDLVLAVGAEVVRVEIEGPREFLGLRFVGTTEAEAELIRRQVFAWQAKARRWQ